MSSGETHLKARYQAPNESHSFDEKINAGLSTESKAKTEYLSDLRSRVKDMQTSINQYLTQRMEEDKNNGPAAQDSSKLGKGDEEEEEEEEQNYGEEKPDDDD